MKILSIVARILLGLAFTAAGLSGFVIFFTSGPPAMPGLAGEFQSVFFRSHWVLFVDAVQLVTGALMLINRFTPLALVAIAAVLANILAFHITLMPLGNLSWINPHDLLASSSPTASIVSRTVASSTRFGESARSTIMNARTGWTCNDHVACNWLSHPGS
jgi:uncharacterized membrane protein YphA (DoxX/SURF4 family)